MKLFIEVEIDNVKDVQEVIELLDVQFVNNDEECPSWVATELYDENDDTVPEIKGFSIYTNLKGKLTNALTGENSDGKSVKWIKENIQVIKQCGKCGTLNYMMNPNCIDCGTYEDFINDSWDRDMEVEILEETHNDDTMLFV